MGNPSKKKSKRVGSEVDNNSDSSVEFIEVVTPNNNSSDVEIIEGSQRRQRDITVIDLVNDNSDDEHRSSNNRTPTSSPRNRKRRRNRRNRISGHSNAGRQERNNNVARRLTFAADNSNNNGNGDSPVVPRGVVITWSPGTGGTALANTLLNRVSQSAGESNLMPLSRIPYYGTTNTSADRNNPTTERNVTVTAHQSSPSMLSIQHMPANSSTTTTGNDSNVEVPPNLRKTPPESLIDECNKMKGNKHHEKHDKPECDGESNNDKHNQTVEEAEQNNNKSLARSESNNEEIERNDEASERSHPTDMAACDEAREAQPGGASQESNKVEATNESNTQGDEATDEKRRKSEEIDEYIRTLPNNIQSPSQNERRFVMTVDKKTALLNNQYYPRIESDYRVRANYKGSCRICKSAIDIGDAIRRILISATLTLWCHVSCTRNLPGPDNDLVFGTNPAPPRSTPTNDIPETKTQLSPEQRERMEKNRLEALRRREMASKAESKAATTTNEFNTSINNEEQSMLIFGSGNDQFIRRLTSPTTETTNVNQEGVETRSQEPIERDETNQEKEVEGTTEENDKKDENCARNVTKSASVNDYPMNTNGERDNVEIGRAHV